MKANHQHTNMPFSCGKRCHPTKASANLAIREMKSRPGCYGAERLNAYWCPTCRAFHVGHSSRPLRRA